MKDCVFCRIVSGEIPKDFTYQDKFVIVFPDLNPQAPTHLLIIPKEHIKEIYYADDPEVLVSVQKAIKKMIDEHTLMGKGYKIEVNGGGYQDVDHLHFHLLGNLES